MTIKPKALRFRVKRAPVSARAGQETPAGGVPEGVIAQPKGSAAPQTLVGAAAGSRKAVGKTEPDAIRHEGLTARQLRLARRMAQKQGLNPTSDFDAVRQLRLKGIDPFARAAMLQLVVPQNEGGNGGVPSDTGMPDTTQSNDALQNGTLPSRAQTAKVQLAHSLPEGRETLPALEILSPAKRREREISEIQKDIQRRRRRKLSLLLTRLAFFVFLPTFMAGWYFYQMATPMYATKAEFLIIQSENQGGGGLGGLLSGTQFATNADSIAVQGYLGSKDAMLRLDKDAGFKSHFTQDFIDPIQRLDPEPTNEEAYKTYKKRVKIGYDPTEGVIRLQVVAADPAVAKLFSEQLINYAEQRVNNLSAQKRDDQMNDALSAFENAEHERRLAQEELVRLQLEGSTLDPEGVIASLRTQISNIEAQVTEKKIEIATLKTNLRPNQAQLNGAETTLRILHEQLAELNAKMTSAAEGETGLAQLTVRIQMAQADLATRDLLLQSALQQVEQTRMEANRQVRYLTTAVAPVASEEPSYPRAFENTILAFLVFGGIYLMISLTASILREQVAS